MSSMSTHSNKWYHAVITAIIALTIAAASPAAGAADSVITGPVTPQPLQMISGKSTILKSTLPVKRVSIADPEVADFILLSPNEIYVTAKKAGTTNLTLWQNGRLNAIYDLEVSYDLSRLKQLLHETLPNEKELRVMATHDSITLAGSVSSTVNLSQAMALARAFAPEEKVTNLVEVGGVHQVMLEIRMAEISKSTTKQFGINFNYSRGDRDFGVSLLGGLSQLVSPDDANIASSGGFGLNVSESVNSFFRFHNGSADWTGFIDALKEDGLVKILAEPTLIALSGQSAEFLAGGEFPVPVPQGLGSVAIEYKKFGVSLAFTPTVLDNNKISIKLTPEVSELDFSTAVQFSGFVIPGITTRQASTVIELGDGQSFAVAGLLQETIRDDISKFPVLGDIPILGALFRSHAFQKNETELVIIATPHLVTPTDEENLSLPTDFYIEPNDCEFYIEGRNQGREKHRLPEITGNLDGEFGHSLPVAGE